MNSTLISVLVAVVSGPISWGILQFFLSRRSRKRQHARDDADLVKARREARNAEEERAELLAEAQATAQRTALESAAERFDSLDEDYRACRDGLREIRSVAFLLVDAMNVLMTRVQPGHNGDEYSAVLTAAEVEKARFAIEQARRRLYS